METEIATVIVAAGALLSGIAALLAVIVAYKIHKNQTLLLQRQLLVPLWDHMATLSKIDPQVPNTHNVVNAVNTLELVALCCEAGMIDERVIKRTFGEQFVMHFDDISKCGVLPEHYLDGPGLLKQNRAATEFYSLLEAERVAVNRLSKP